jgi:O-antigen ligase
VAVLVTNLSSTPKRNDFVFIPIILSLIISAIVGFKQSKYGMGLSLDQLNFRVDQFGYMALGFQQDIHAFAGQMLIGSIGLFGYMYYTKQLSTKLLIVTAIPLCWIALFLSKSKSTFALSVVCLIFIALIWLFRHARLTMPVLKAILIAVILTAISAVIFQQAWIYALTHFVHFIGLPNIEALNDKLSYRPEVYLAALKMFTLDPLLGLGQSEFYRQAADFTLTNSRFLSIEQNGENAHNYFLQTLVETGLVGICVFALLIFYPIWCLKDKRVLLPAGVGLGAIFVGNIFAHSMLVRENLFIAAGFIGLMYASVGASDKKDCSVSFFKYPSIVFALLFSLSVLTIREVYLSYRSSPFTEDVQCLKARPLDRDGWTSGLYKVAIPEGARGMTLELKGIQPGVAARPLAAVLSIKRGENSVIQTNDILFKEDGPRKLRIDFPQNAVADDGEYRVELRLQRCFIPRNMGINADGRRLGIQIQGSTANFE